MSEKKFCILPWTHFASEPTGTVRPCCIATEVIQDGNTSYNLEKHSVKEIFHSGYMKKMRQDFRDGRFPSACSVCKLNEDNGVESKREQHNRWSIQSRNIDLPDFESEPVSPADLQIILSNKCNLKCRSCNGVYSTKWIQESIDRNLFDDSYVKEFKALHVGDKFIESLDSWVSYIRHLEYMGGEPTFQDEFRILTDKIIQTGKAKNIILSFSSNMSISAESILEKLCENFSHVSLNMSLDGIGNRFEYIRHGAKWSVVRGNILSYISLMYKDLAKFSTSVTHTVSWLNAYYVSEFFEEMYNIDPKLRIYINLVHSPEHLNSAHLPVSVKQEIIFKLKSYSELRPIYKIAIENLISHLQGSISDSDLFLHGIQMTKNADVYRQEDYTKVFPEMYELVKSEWSDSKLFKKK